MTQTTQHILIFSLGLTALFEAVTVLFRFGFKLESTRDTAQLVARWTRGIRVHHGYWGVPLALIGAGIIGLYGAGAWPAVWMLIVGLALIKSDLVHHFLVLWPITGEHQFDLVYPCRKARVRARRIQRLSISPARG